MRFGHVSCVGLNPGRSHSLLGNKTSRALNTGYVYGWIYGLFIISIALTDLGSNNLFPTFFYLREEPVCHNLMPHLIAQVFPLSLKPKSRPRIQELQNEKASAFGIWHASIKTRCLGYHLFLILTRALLLRFKQTVLKVKLGYIKKTQPNPLEQYIDH